MTKVIVHDFPRSTYVTQPTHGIHMIMSRRGLCLASAIALILCAGLTTGTRAAPVEPVQTFVAKEKAPLLATLKDLISIESFSGDRRVSSDQSIGGNVPGDDGTRRDNGVFAHRHGSIRS